MFDLKKKYLDKTTLNFIFLWGEKKKGKKRKERKRGRWDPFFQKETFCPSGSWLPLWRGGGTRI